MGGADTIEGGAGTDTASYASSGSGVTVNMATGVGSGGDAEGDTLTSIESVIGSNHDDVLIIGDTNFNTFKGLNGTDTIRVSGSGVALDLGDHSISGIEIVDLTGTGANSLDLTAADVRQASGALEAGKAILRIDGDADDRVNFLDDGWTRLETTRTIDGTEYAVFDHADARVLVAIDIAGAGGGTKPGSEIEGTAGAGHIDRDRWRRHNFRIGRQRHH